MVSNVLDTTSDLKEVPEVTSGVQYALDTTSDLKEVTEVVSAHYN